MSAEAAPAEQKPAAGRFTMIAGGDAAVCEGDVCAVPPRETVPPREAVPPREMAPPLGIMPAPEENPEAEAD